MKYCVRCGRMLNTGDEFCSGCGMRQPYVPPELLNDSIPEAPRTPVPAVPTYALVPVYGMQTAPRRKNGFWPFFIWSLILVPLFNIIGTPLAVVAAMLTLTADADGGPGSDRKLGTAAVLCIIATVVDIVTLVLLSTSAIAVSRGMSIFR